MHKRLLGKTGLEVSAIAFGAGPIAELMTSPQRADEQVAVMQRAVELGINWFDTAATYGQGRSEAALGQALQTLQITQKVHVATKVRISPENKSDIRNQIKQSVAASLERLRLPRVTLLQLHNSITAERGAQPTSLTPDDVLGPVLETFKELQRAGLVEHIGLTGLGEPAAIKAVLAADAFATVQTPYHLLDPSAGCDGPPNAVEQGLGDIVRTCAESKMGVFAIRVFAGGALAGKPPSKHTLTTPFFPLALYERDRARAAALAACLPPKVTLPEMAVRFALTHPGVSSAIVGFATPDEVTAAVEFAERGPLAEEELHVLG